MTPSQVLDAMIADPSINGQHVDVDNEFGGQCWDLVELFAERCGVPKAPWAITLGPLGAAKEAWTVFDSHMQAYFTKIPAGQQQKGDITVYDGHTGFEDGHIAISLGGAIVFEENADPDGATAHVYNNRSSQYLLGALRLKEGNNMPTTSEQAAATRLANLQKIATAVGFSGNPDSVEGILATLSANFTTMTNFNNVFNIAETRFGYETQIANALGVSNPDDVASILKAIQTLKTSSGTLSKDAIIQYLQNELPD